jgi:hypothetical protein
MKENENKPKGYLGSTVYIDGNQGGGVIFGMWGRG